MAQLELARVVSTNGAAAIAGAAGTAVETEGETVARSPSFSQLLRVGAAPAANPRALQLNPTVIDPASLDQAGAGQQLVALAVTLGAELATGEGEPGESEETVTETGAGDSDTTDGEMLVGTPWLGLPLVMEARAALRNVGSSGIEPSSPSGVTATADSVDAARLHFMLRSTTAPGRLADGDRGSVRLPGAPMSETLASGYLAPATPATGEAGGLPLAVMDSTVGSASNDTVSTLLDGPAVSSLEGLRTLVARQATTAAAIKIVSDGDQPLSPASQGLSSLVTPAQAYQRSADAVVTPMTLHPEKALQDAGTGRADEPTAPATGGTLTQTGPLSAAPARPDAGTAPASLPTAPDILDLHQKNWERTMGHQLNWMVNNRLQEAEIKVNPPDLGPLEVRVSLHHNQTNVTFFSHEAAVREAIESALPRLREMLDGQGINLNQAQVSDQSLARQQAGAGEQPSYGQRDGRLPTTAPDPETAEDVAESRPRSRGLPGMVDDYV